MPGRLRLPDRPGGARAPAPSARWIRRRRAAVVALTLPSLVLGGCAERESPDLASGVDVDIAASADAGAVLDRSAGTIELPIDAYFLDPAAQGRVVQANALLLDACLRESGRSYPPAELGPVPRPPLADGVYGVWTREQAARSGYELDAERTAMMRALDESVLAASRADAGWGPAFADCLESTEHLPELGRDSADAASLAITELPRRVRERARSAAESTREWAAVRARWSACLVEHGLVLRTGERSPGTPEVPVEREDAVRTALIDVGCKEETALVETLSELEARDQAALIARERTALAELAEREHAVAVRAEEILATLGE
ncbi:hypothetical protein HRK28_11730 [Rathayibacter sp. VKM Ac-2835]|uniref:hypothetical protein n=1 Tax=Rathayibacter sp. VKM Ac-2835 TaxID=2739043 RepID=UPI0015679551|nr:hypothetical protein [Rathayibacter sp. VKM Ac-2835]NRG41587.1 hypothetical protein [Rathayibacter sp. VKM Ac-2835]